MDRNEFIGAMTQYFNKESEVGLFWYNPTAEELFEVHSIPVTSLKENIFTYPKLHKTIWKKLQQSAKIRKENELFYDPIYLKDYNQVPRGRVSFRGNIFCVSVGDWLTEKIKKKIIKQFNLQKCKVRFSTSL